MAATMFIAAGLVRNEKVTLGDLKPQINHIKFELDRQRVNVQSHVDSGQFSIVPLETVLKEFLRKGNFDETWMKNLVNVSMKEVDGKYSQVRYVLRLAPLIAEAGRPKMAASMELLWDKLVSNHPSAMLCSYSMKDIDSATNYLEHWGDIMRKHTFILSDIGLVLPLKPSETVPHLEY
jgi:hypothetical protein